MNYAKVMLLEAWNSTVHAIGIDTNT
jgi:hypothetical protein